MSVQNEMRRVKKTNLEYTARRLRMEIETLTRTICVNLDTSLKRPEDLPIPEVDSQVDELKAKWAELIHANSEISAIEEALS
jgi:hypothetical protein